MAEIITATFQDGAFVPEQEIAVPPGTRVRLTVEPMDEKLLESSLEKKTPLGRACEQHPIYSGLRLTRDQLHERD